jgi:hypothetical protein
MTQHEHSQPHFSTLPLAPHDVFVYLLPGAAALVLIFLWEFAVSHALPADVRPPTPVFTALHASAVPDNWAYMFLSVLATLGAAYVCGHLTAWIAVMMLEMVVVQRGLGYPYQVLLGLTTSDRYRRAANIARTMCGNIAFLSFYLAHWPWGLEWLPIAWDALFILSLSLLLFLLLFGPRTLELVAAPSVEWTRLGNLLLGPLGYRDSLPSKLRDQFADHFRDRFGLEVTDAASECYWLPRLTILREAPEFDQKIDYLHRLSSFSRNLSATFFLSWLYCACSVSFHCAKFAAATHRGIVFGSPLLFLVISGLLFIRFCHLYASRETRMLVRCFVHVCNHRAPQDR